MEEIAGGARPKLPDMPDIIEKTDPEPLDELDQAAKVEAMTAEFESITPSKAYFAPGDKIRTVFDRHCKQYEHTFTAFTWNMLAGGVQWLNANGMDAQVEYWLEKHVWLPVIDKINCFGSSIRTSFTGWWCSPLDQRSAGPRLLTLCYAQLVTRRCLGLLTSFGRLRSVIEW